MVERDMKVQGTELVIGEKRVDFGHPIEKVLDREEYVVVLLALTGEPYETFHKNVIAVNTDGSIRWKIENRPEREGRYRPYSNIYEKDDELWAYNVGGMAYRIDEEDGSLLEREFRK